MGQCYSVTMKLKYNNEEELHKQLVKAMQSQNCFWHTKDWSESTETLLKKFLYDIDISIKQFKNGSTELKVSSAFEQLYSWESLMIDIFKELTPAINNGSSLVIYPDSDYDRLVIKDGKCVQTH